MSTTYQLSREQLRALLFAAIDMYEEYQHAKQAGQAAVDAVSEMLEGLDFERELVNEGDLDAATMQLYQRPEVTS